MAINPTRYDMPGSFVGTIDWSPLGQIAAQLKEQRDQEEAAQLIARLYGRGNVQPQQAMAAPPVQAQPPRPRDIQTAALPPPAPDIPLTPNERVERGFLAFPGSPAAPQAPAPPPMLASTPGPAPAPPGPISAPPMQPIPGATAMPLPSGLQRTPDEPISAPPMQPIPGATAMPVPSDLQRTPPAMAFAPEDDPLERYARATSSIESGSPQGNYRLVGPQTRTGDRAFGRYQVMGTNVPEWTEKYYGQRLTPREFLLNPEAQDAVYRGEFGRLVQKHGPTGAAKAWFAGERGMNNPNARDILGTTVSSYADRFDRAAGGLPSEIAAGRTERSAASAERPPAYDRMAANLRAPSMPTSDAGVTSDEIAALYRNPVTRPLATAFLQKQLDPGTYKFMAAGDNIVRYNERTGEWTPLPISQKPVVVDKKLVDPNSGKVIYGGDDAYPNDPPANYRWADPKDKAKGVVPVEGGPAEKIEAEVGARLGLAKSFLGELPDIKDRLEKGELGVENPAAQAKALAGLGVPGELRRKIDSGADALVRMLSGAGMNIQEAQDYVRRYRLGATDTKAVLLSKMTQLERELTSIGEVMGRGRGGNIVAPGATTQGGGLAVGKVYHGRPYLGGPPGDPKSWGPRVQ